MLMGTGSFRSRLWGRGEREGMECWGVSASGGLSRPTHPLPASTCVHNEVPCGGTDPQTQSLAGAPGCGLLAWGLQGHRPSPFRPQCRSQLLDGQEGGAGVCEPRWHR